MDVKKLATLILAVSVAVFIWFFTSRTEEPSNSTKTLFSDVITSEIVKMSLTSEGKAVELVKTKDGWVLPNRDNYPTDPDKVKRFFLNIFDISLYEKIPSGPELFEQLKLDGKSGENSSQARFFDAKGSSLLEVYLGDNKQSKGVSKQFLRAANSNQVYLLPNSVSIDNSANSWIDLEVINILSSKVSAVSLQRSDELLIEASLEEKKDKSDKTESSFIATAGKLLNSTSQEQAKTALDKLRAGLENIRLEYVYSSENESIKELNFDRTTRYTVNTGVVYRVETGRLGDKHYLKISANSNPEILVRQHETESNDLKSKPSADLSVDLSDKTNAIEVEEVVSKEDSAKIKAEKEKKRKELLNSRLANLESRVLEINAKYSPWVYEISELTAHKLRFHVENLQNDSE